MAFVFGHAHGGGEAGVEGEVAVFAVDGEEGLGFGEAEDGFEFF